MKVCLMTMNAQYIHKAMSLRWLYVAKDPQFETEIVEYTIRDDLNGCVQDMISRKPDIVGCSVYIWNAELMKAWILLLKEAMPAVRIIIGGPEVSFEPEEWLEYPVECVLRGEGEHTFWQAVRKEEKIDGYFSQEWKSDCAYAKTDIAYLETLESPYFLKQDLDSMANRYFYFETSRGCPYRCSYCLSSLDNHLRFFSLPYIKKQLLQLKKIGVKQVKMLDRTFNAHRQASFELLRWIEAEDIQACFQFEIVADTLSEEMLNFLLYEAKVERYRFEIGVQSFHLKTLQAVDRVQDNDRCKMVIQLLTKRGYTLHVDLIGGLPYEDLTQFAQSFNVLFLTGAREIQVGILKLLKGTKLRQEATKYDIHYESVAPYTVQSTAWLDNLAIEQIYLVYQAAEKMINSGRLYHTFHTLVQLGIITDVFALLQRCGQRLKAVKQIQIADYFLVLQDELEFLCSDRELIQAILLTDYMMLFNQKPKRIFEDQVSSMLHKLIFEECINTLQIPEKLLYNYSKLQHGFFENKICVQLLIYSNCHKKVQRIWFERDTGKVIEDERNLDCNNKSA